jgi:hypothetical protein
LEELPLDRYTISEQFEAIEPVAEPIAADAMSVDDQRIDDEQRIGDDWHSIAADGLSASDQIHADAIATAQVVDQATAVEATGIEATAVETRVAASTLPIPDLDLSAAAYLCTELARADGTTDLAPLLQGLATVVDAVGLIVWVWDPRAGELTPALPHGYSPDVVAQLPNVPRDARNATATAFRSARMCVVNGSHVASDAVAVPLITPRGCAGVLAIELQHGGAQRESVRALATIFAAQMARAVGDQRPAVGANRRLA